MLHRRCLPGTFQGVNEAVCFVVANIVLYSLILLVVYKSLSNQDRTANIYVKFLSNALSCASGADFLLR